MSHIIGLTSIRPSGESLVFVQVSELVNETLFALDRAMRSAVRERPWAEWPFLAARLNQEGYTSVHARVNMRSSFIQGPGTSIW